YRIGDFETTRNRNRRWPTACSRPTYRGRWTAAAQSARPVAGSPAARHARTRNLLGADAAGNPRPRSASSDLRRCSRRPAGPYPEPHQTEVTDHHAGASMASKLDETIASVAVIVAGRDPSRMIAAAAAAAPKVSAADAATLPERWDPKITSKAAGAPNL